MALICLQVPVNPNQGLSGRQSFGVMRRDHEPCRGVKGALLAPPWKDE